MPDELREALEKAYDDEDSKETPDESAGHDDGQPPVDAAGDGSTTGKPGAATAEGAEGEGEPSGSPPEAEGDAPGVEAPAGEEEADGGAKFLPPEGAGDDKGAPPAETVSEKVPVAWRGAAKQHWADLPTEVRQEVIRREREVDEVLHASGEARKFQQDFERTVKPFEGFMAADGVSSIQATGNLMRTAATLQVGSPQQKAAIAHDIIKRYGIDINMLDSMLAGETPAPPSPSMGGNGSGAPAGDPTMRYIDQRLAPVNQFIQGLQGAQKERQETLDREVDTEYEQFAADPENIFLEDVKGVMADLLQAAGKNGRKMTFKEAYDLAVNMDPDKARIQKQRNAAKTAAARNESLAQKKRAAASVQGTSVTPSQATPTDMRGQLNAAWDAQGGGT